MIYIENSDFGKRVMTQFKSQEDTNATILSMLASLQKTMDKSFQDTVSSTESHPLLQKSSGLKLRKKKRKKEFRDNSSTAESKEEVSLHESISNTADTGLRHRLLELSAGTTMRRDRVCNDEIPEWYSSTVEGILVEQYQRSRECMENVRSEAHFLNSLMMLKRLKR